MRMLDLSCEFRYSSVRHLLEHTAHGIRGKNMK
jgi:hypothetical protein